VRKNSIKFFTCQGHLPKELPSPPTILDSGNSRLPQTASINIVEFMPLSRFAYLITAAILANMCRHIVTSDRASGTGIITFFPSFLSSGFAVIFSQLFTHHHHHRHHYHHYKSHFPPLSCIFTDLSYMIYIILKNPLRHSSFFYGPFLIQFKNNHNHYYDYNGILNSYTLRFSSCNYIRWNE
jgi:hypothetical protein